MVHTIEYAALSVQGTARRKNEDNLLCAGRFLPEKHSDSGEVWSGSTEPETPALFCVFDGTAGGHQGETASFLAATSFRRQFENWDEDCPYKGNDAFIGGMVHNTDQEIRDWFGYRTSMSSTAAGILFGNHGITGFHTGDSRIYQLQGKKIRRVTRDHVFQDPGSGRRILGQALGMSESGMEYGPDIVHLTACPDTTYLICTNGLTRRLTDGEISVILRGDQGLSDRVRMLTEEARRHGSRDDITVILCRCFSQGGSQDGRNSSSGTLE